MGEPKDQPEECNARLYIGDNYGDNHATMRCQRAPGHPGLHREEYSSGDQEVAVEWKNDESMICSKCNERTEQKENGICYRCSEKRQGKIIASSPIADDPCIGHRMEE